MKVVILVLAVGACFLVTPSSAAARPAAAERVLPVLVEALDDEDVAVRLHAAEALGDLGPMASVAVPRLVELLGDQTWVADRAAKALVAIGAPAVPALVTDLKKAGHPRIDEILEGIGAPAVPALLEVLRGSRGPIRLRVVQVLGGIGPEAAKALPRLSALMAEPGVESRGEIVRAIGGLGASAVPALIEALYHYDPVVRESAAGALGRIGPDARAAVPLLMASLRDDIGSVVAASARALGGIGTDAKSAVPELISLVRCDEVGSWGRSLAAVEALGGIGPSAADAIPALSGIVRTHTDAEYRLMAAEALGKIGLPDASVATTFMASLADSQLGYGIALVLGRIGPPGAQILGQALTKGQERARRNAVTGLWGCRWASLAVPALIDALCNGAPTIRESTVHVLENIGAGASLAVPALIRALDDSDRQVRWGAAAALGKIGRAAEPAVPRLMQALRYESDWLSLDDALGGIGAPAVPPLITMTQEGPQAREVAIRVLSKIGPEARGAIPVLMEALHSAQPSTVRLAVEALGNIGPAAAAAVPEALRYLRDADPAMRSACAQALGRIGTVEGGVLLALIAVAKDVRAEVRSQAVQALGRLQLDD